MSAIVGLVQLDGRPADRPTLDSMCAAVAYRGPDGMAHSAEGPCGLAALALHTSAHQRAAPAVARTADGRFSAILDGILDNRNELRHALFPGDARQIADVALVLAAYQRWGSDAPRRLIGDFAFAIWDNAARRLFLARDPVGMRLLYYARTGRHFLFGTTIAALLAAYTGRPALNHAVLAEFLDHRYERSVHETFYAGLLRLPQGCTLTVDADGRSDLRRFWHFGEEPQPATDEACIARFRAAFEEAVRCRLDGLSPVGLMLSGGLDSSSVAVVAEHLLARAPDGGWPQLRTYSLTYERTPSLDERAYLEAVLARCPTLVPTRIPADDFGMLAEGGTDNDFPLDEPDIWGQRAQSMAALRPAVADGCRRILSGYGGDQVLGFAYQSGAIFREMGPRHWRQEFPHFRRLMGSDERLLRRVGAALLPAVLVDPVRPALHRLRPPRPTVLRAEWLRRVRAHAPPPFRLDPPDHLPASAHHMLATIQGGWFSTCLAYNDRLAAALGLEFRDPFLDRRVVEALTTIPWHLRYGSGRRKLILRRALHDLLPPELLARDTAATSTDLINRGLMTRDRVAPLIEQTIAQQHEWLDADSFRREWAAYWQGHRPNHWPLMTPLYVTIWADANGIALS